MIREIEKKALSGGLMLILLLVLIGFGLLGLISAAKAQDPARATVFAIADGILVVLVTGLFTVQPNQGKALQLFGSYAGTVRTAGLWWANPFFTKRGISLRVRNFETTKLKVNDHSSNPIEIAAVVVWQVTDTAEALFEVDNYEDYVKVQSESALRGLANQYPYDAHQEGQMSLSVNTADVAEKLKGEIQERLLKAGVKDSRGAHQPPGLRPGDRRRDAAAPAGERRDRRPADDRRGRGRHGRDGAGAALAEGDRPARRGAQGRDGEQSAGGALLRAVHPAGGQRRHHLLGGVVAERKPFLLRIDPELYDALQRWASDDLRSLNGQLEFLLRQSLKDAGRLSQRKSG